MHNDNFSSTTYRLNARERDIPSRLWRGLIGGLLGRLGMTRYPLLATIINVSGAVQSALRGARAGLAFHSLPR